MRKTTLLTAAFLAAGLAAGARTLSPSQALSRALSDQNVSQSALQRAPRVAAPVITVTGGEEAEPAVYVFKGDSGIGGYLIVSASDVAAPVLGYSDNGTFDPANIPPQMKWWLDEYAAAIASAEAAGATEWTAPSRSERTPVGPLCATSWNQGEPYNNDCPEYETGKKSATGCVATAMAQVMKYHNYPEKGSGVSIYNWQKPDGNYQQLYMNLAVTFDWANMLDSYSGSYTDEQASAVATLMKACGYSIHMGYGPSSGAYGFDVPIALVENYGYDKWARLVYRSSYTTQGWDDAIYNNLVECGPLLLGGGNNEGGHSFVCDGYAANGYFHINWGWGGISDGYFKPSALDPDQQGIGGTNAGYNSGQDAVLGIQKPVESHTDVRPAMTSDIPVTCELSGSSGRMSGAFMSCTPMSTFQPDLGIRITDTSGNEIASTCTYKVSYTAGSGVYYSWFSFSTAQIPQGTSHIYPAFKFLGEVYDIECPASQMPYIIATRNGSKITFETPEKGKFSVTNVELTTPMYAGRDFTIKADGVWTGSEGVHLEFNPALYNSTEQLVALGSAIGVDFNANSEPTPFSYDGDWRNITTSETYTPEPGDYYYSFVYYDGHDYQTLCEKYPVTIAADPGEGEISVFDVSIENSDDVNPHALTFTSSIYCSKGYYTSGIMAAIFKYTDGYPYVGSIELPLVMTSGEMKEIKHTLDFGDLVVGEKYLFALFNTKQLSNAELFTVGDYTGIEGVGADAAPGLSPNPATDFTTVSASADIKGIQVVGMSGSPAAVAATISGNTATLDVSTLPKGIYIVVVTTDSGISTAKLVKK